MSLSGFSNLPFDCGKHQGAIWINNSLLGGALLCFADYHVIRLRPSFRRLSDVVITQDFRDCSHVRMQSITMQSAMRVPNNSVVVNQSLECGR